MVKFLLGMLTMAAIGAYLTNPSAADAESALRKELLDAISEERIKGKTAAESAALLGCRLDPGTCFDLLRSMVDLKIEDRHLYSRLDLDGLGHRATCYGLFTQFVCPGGFETK